MTQTMSDARQNNIRVLVAGIGGASLGTEIMKCLRFAGGYHVFGCDVSELAFGHYDGLAETTALVKPARYIDDIIHLCEREQVQIIIPGGDQPAKLLSTAQKRLQEEGILLAANSPLLVANLIDKNKCFRLLDSLGILTPKTWDPDSPACDMPMPCIVKPARESGGSSFVFFARTKDDANIYVQFLIRNGIIPVVQEYIDHDKGEFTVGVLSDISGRVSGSIALKRSFSAKLSVLLKGSDFLISSGYSQGRIERYDDIRLVCESIAKSLDSRGPLNIQGRINRDGKFVPFEINPRFSASTYLRTLAGFNEVDYYLKSLLGFDLPEIGLNPGNYLRSLTEICVSDAQLLSAD